MRNGPANAAYYGVYEWAREAQLKAGQTKSELAKYDCFISLFIFISKLSGGKWFLQEV